MTDLTAPLEAACRARWDQARRGYPGLPSWEHLAPLHQHRIREDLLPVVAAVVEAVAGEQRAVEDEAWRRQFVGITASLDLSAAPPCGHWHTGPTGEVVRQPVLGCPTCT